MAGWTNKGKVKMLDSYFRNTSAANPSASFYVWLATNTNPPTATTNKTSDCTEIATGNGYTQGGQAVNRNSTDFDVLTEDDTNNRGLVQLKDYTWTAGGGPIPSGGDGARWVILGLDKDNAGSAATAASGDRVVLAFWDLGSDRSITAGQSVTVTNLELRCNE